MPWLDLHEGILEEFEAAQERSERVLDHSDAHRITGRGRRDRCDAMFRRRMFLRKAREEVRALRAAQPRYVIAPLPVKRVRCPNCGGMAESRVGTSKVFHRGSLGCGGAP